MTITPQALLNRLNEIAQSLAASGHALALLGLGSVGTERARLDAHSDLDFFVIVEPGYQRQYVEDLSWMRAVRPIAYAFQNTAVGCKLLYDDGIFCEYAVFEPAELATAVYTGGQIVWQRADFDPDTLSEGQPPTREARTVDWLIGEAITNLYVGLSRLRRGEVLSAQRFIQHYAVDRLLELVPLVETESPGLRDVFGDERRFEQRFPQAAQLLPQFVQGYGRSRESALAILAFLDTHFPTYVNAAMKAEIVRLAEAP